MAGSGTGPVKGRQMGWLRHVLTVLSVLIFVSNQKQRQTQTLSQIGWLRHVPDMILVQNFIQPDFQAKSCTPQVFRKLTAYIIKYQ